MEKKDSKMFKYIKKVIDLARKKEVKAAANVLTRIANCVLQSKFTISLNTIYQVDFFDNNNKRLRYWIMFDKRQNEGQALIKKDSLCSFLLIAQLESC